MPPELFVEEDVVTVGGNLKFIRGIQGLKERGSQGSERWWRLACISFVFFWFSFVLSSFSRFAYGSSLASPVFSFPVGSWGREGNL